MCGGASTTAATARERSDNHRRRDTPITDPTEPTRYAFEYPDEAGYPDGKGTLSKDQIALIDELLDDPHVPAFDFEVVKDEKVGIYEANRRRYRDRRPALQRRRRPTRVAGHLGVPEFRKQGIATELIRRVLDDVRAQGKTVTIMCRIVRTFIERNPEYADLIDPEHPGVTKGLPRRKV
jgi:predicted GNAT family acetyltransferase